jgi:FkbM family methyltransferase
MLNSYALVSFKSTAASLLKAFARSVPHGARRALTAGLSERDADRFELLSYLAQAAGVDGFLVSGDYGSIQSSSQDTKVLRLYAETGRFAHRTNELLTAFFRDPAPATYIDIGANIGLTTIPVAQFPHVSCLAIEPEPTNYQNLVANVGRNCPHGNVRTRQLAVFREAGTIQFELATDNLGDHRLRLTQDVGAFQEQDRRVITVEAAPLDAVTTDLSLNRVGIKIDVQGAEAFVFEGGRDTLARVGLLILEFWPYGIARMKADPEVILDVLESQFATVALGVDEGAALSAPATALEATRQLRELMTTKAHDPYFYVDIVATQHSGAQSK